MDRHRGQTQTSSPFRYRDYFNAVSGFLKDNGFDIPVRAVSASLNRNIAQNDIKAIHIHLEKHGEFYHPARVRVVLNDREALFVLNVAVSGAGLDIITGEFDILDRLSHSFPNSHLPKVFGQGERITENGAVVKMFFGEWFDGFHEFHISNQHDCEKGIVVWDPVRGRFPLSPDQMEALYRQAAYILTCYYDPETFEQIYPWHHAAGDFIVRLDERGRVALRLITVRNYKPLVGGSEPEAHDLQSIMEAMLLFFLNLSIRTRLDRMEGVDDITWSNDIAVKATAEGFFNALSKKSPIAGIPVPLTECFMVFLSGHTPEDLLDISHGILGRYHPHSPEPPVIKENLEKHIRDIYRFCVPDT